jgi:NTP pyrophosphatase (non-canonical NTP hydrolase)
MNDIQAKHRAFTKERNWESFHNPKSLAIALSVEASELLEIFTWLTDAQSLTPNPSRLQAIRDEMADVYLYLLRLADVLNIDLLEATNQKFVKVEQKYPLDRSLALAKSIRES